MSNREKALVGALAAGAVAAGATGYYYMRKYRECANGSARTPAKPHAKA
ncbi:MAG TPA: hypothetical protein VJ485_02770 [archaeon]|nr:hypothetical protein [archaeon]